MSKSELAEKVVSLMLENDQFTRWMKMELVSLSPGNCEIKMEVRKEMLNGFSIAHGAIEFALLKSSGCCILLSKDVCPLVSDPYHIDEIDS